MMKKTLLITTSLLAISTPTFAFQDSDARRAILELRAQLQQASDSRIQMMNRIENLEQLVSQLQDQLQQNLQTKNTVGFDDVPQVGDVSEQNAYNQAYAHYLDAQYIQAARSFSQFIKDNPSSALRNHANFFLGSSLYASQQYKEAIATLETLIATEPNFKKTPDALLLIFAANQKLHKKKAAKTALNQIIDQYPSSEAANKARQYLRKTR